eukprot:scaffold213326_cov17-Prasinocladus_malaysianus.AAC.2
MPIEFRLGKIFITLLTFAAIIPAAIVLLDIQCLQREDVHKFENETLGGTMQTCALNCYLIRKQVKILLKDITNSFAIRLAAEAIGEDFERSEAGAFHVIDDCTATRHPQQPDSVWVASSGTIGIDLR